MKYRWFDDENILYVIAKLPGVSRMKSADNLKKTPFQMDTIQGASISNLIPISGKYKILLLLKCYE